jgi:hypothetical protein
MAECAVSVHLGKGLMLMKIPITIAQVADCLAYSRQSFYCHIEGTNDVAAHHCVGYLHAKEQCDKLNNKKTGISPKKQ